MSRQKGVAVVTRGRVAESYDGLGGIWIGALLLPRKICDILTLKFCFGFESYLNIEVASGGVLTPGSQKLVEQEAANVARGRNFKPSVNSHPESTIF